MARRFLLPALGLVPRYIEQLNPIYSAELFQNIFSKLRRRF
jgi:hypothetical protein